VTGAWGPAADLSLLQELGILALLIGLAAFFSSTETALMTVNRYRLRHLAREGSAAARVTDGCSSGWTG
jgi:Mg2+/Co2+ transporter CorB